MPHGHWKTTTFVGALRCDGLTAPLVVDGAINDELSLAYVEQVLVPTVKRGDIRISLVLSVFKWQHRLRLWLCQSTLQLMMRKRETESKGTSMYNLKIASVVILGMAALVSCASQPSSAPPPTAALGATDGTITFTGGAVAIGVGFQWGSGTLTYQGQQYPFRLEGLSVVDVGVTRITGNGTVRNLRNVADFNGNYVSASAGATVAGGGSVMTLRNQNGVVIDGVSTAQGVRLTLAPGGVNIKLSSQ